MLSTSESDRVSDAQALDAVAELLDSDEWSSDHLEAVAEIVRATGRIIGDLA